MSLKLKKKLANPVIIAAIIGLIGTLFGTICTVHFSKPPEQSKSVKQSSSDNQSPNIIGNNNSITYEKSSK